MDTLPTLALMTDYRRASRMIRAACEQRGTSYPIVVDHSAAGRRRKPRLEGQSYHWTTPGGTPIRYPSAYRWAKVYHASTLRIVVGAEWVARHVG